MGDSDLYRKVRESLRKNGFWFLRHGKGHDIWTNGYRKVSVPINMRSRHTASGSSPQNVVRMAGLPSSYHVEISKGVRLSEYVKAI